MAFSPIIEFVSKLIVNRSPTRSLHSNIDGKCKRTGLDQEVQWLHHFVVGHLLFPTHKTIAISENLAAKLPAKVMRSYVF